MTNKNQYAAEEKEFSYIVPKFIHTFSVGVVFDVIFSPCFSALAGDPSKYSYMDVSSVFGAFYDITIGGFLLPPRDCHMIAAEIARIGFTKYAISQSYDSIEYVTGLTMFATGLAGELICSYNEY